jgi:hypothetical protein
MFTSHRDEQARPGPAKPEPPSPRSPHPGSKGAWPGSVPVRPLATPPGAPAFRAHSRDPRIPRLPPPCPVDTAWLPPSCSSYYANEASTPLGAARIGQEARTISHDSLSGAQEYQGPGPGAYPSVQRSLKLNGFASGLVNARAFVTMACVPCAKGFTIVAVKSAAPSRRSAARYRGGGTPDDRARKPHGAAPPAGR